MRDVRFSKMQALVDSMYKKENITKQEPSSILKSAEQIPVQAQHASYLKFKPESELLIKKKVQNPSKANTEHVNEQTHPTQMQHELSKHDFQHGGQTTDDKKTEANENDFYKSWLEQNSELEVSLLKTSQIKKQKPDNKSQRSEIELIPLTKTDPEKLETTHDVEKTIGFTVLKSDLDQFLEGKEVSSSGLFRKDLEAVMMGRFNPNRRYSNEAMWAALMDVKKGASIYRAAQTHKVPTKSLRNWMKLCRIKSSIPMPQPLKKFVESNKKKRKHKSDCNTDQNKLDENSEVEQNFENEIDFGNHFLFNDTNISSEDEEDSQELNVDPSTILDMTLQE